MTSWSILWIVLAVLVVAAVAVAAFLLTRPGATWRERSRRPSSRPTTTTLELPPVADVAEAPPTEAPLTERRTDAPPLETPEPTAGRLQRLRARLARSQNTLGRGLLSVLSREHLDDEAWDEVEEALLTADVGVKPTTEIVERLRTRTKVLGTRSPARAARPAGRRTGRRPAARPRPHAARHAVVATVPPWCWSSA